MNTITAILQYGKNKHCFLTLVDSYQRRSTIRPAKGGGRDDGLTVYEVELPHGQKAFFSVHGQRMELMSGDTVQLNGWYANKLGLKDGEPIILRPIKSVVPSARRVQVEPVAPDDWEILEKNAGRVEIVLLDQVRVIWPGQIFPVWIQKSVCIYMKIVGVEPMSPCVVLESSTELVVASKVRAYPPPSSLSLPSHQHIPNMPGRPQRKSHPQTSKSQSQTTPLTSPCQAKAEALTSSSEWENLDTLEPKPVNRSPSQSPRPSSKKLSAHRKKQLSGSKDYCTEKGEITNRSQMVKRQSSLMNSMMRYIFPFISGDKPEEVDNLSDSDGGSAIDYSMQHLPSRSGVLRVQPISLSCSLEECFTIKKAEINREILAKSILAFRQNVQKPPTNTNWEIIKQCNVPKEVFQPTTVYVDAECTKNERLLHPYLPVLPRNFIARMQRLPSPQEKVEASQRTNKKRDSGREREGSGGPGTSQQLQQPTSPQAPPSASESSDGADFTDFSGSCYVRVVAIDRKAGLTDDAWQGAADKILTEQPLLFGHVLVPDLLRRQLRLEATSMVWLQTGTVDLVIPHKVCIYPLAQLGRKITNDILITAFRHYIKQCASADHPMVVFQGVFVKYLVFEGTAVEVQLTFYGENDVSSPKAVTLLSELNIDSVLVTIEKNSKEEKMGVIRSMLSYSKIDDFDPPLYPVKLKHLGGIEEIAKQAIIHLHASMGARPLSRMAFQARAGLSHGMLLVTGPKGCGKTSFVKGLCRKMGHPPVMAHITMIDCKTLRGKGVSQIQKILELVFDEAAWRQPAMLVFENLEVIIPAPSGPESDMSGEALYSAKNAQMLQGLINYELENNSRVSIVATCTSLSALHSSLTKSRGMHFIQYTLNIAAPDKAAREKILLSILQNHSSVTMETVKTLDLAQIAMKTEGFVARDLESLVNRAVHTRLVRDREAYQDKMTLSLEDFEEALCDFKPASIRNVQLHKPGEQGWEDVGGLQEVKTSLRETLIWPTKYPQLFSASPLRLRTGILLYGAPGTGKTLLASVLAKECGLNFISIKGPELLSKYIGASEQAVRQLFVRAQSAKPCILFFDEFDSIAPKRGHDSTGVTDRVVNQLLTQLDGVESLKGVYVLGATSRPDLIDPALLRPGRLDKSVYCAIPDKTERGEILQALTRKMCLAGDVDLEEVAAVCQDFTGADLKALLYNAQLKAIHEQTEKDQNSNDSVVRIKGDYTQCLAIRRASIPFVESVIPSLQFAASRSSANSSVDNLNRSGDLESTRSTESLQSPRDRLGQASPASPASPRQKIRLEGKGEDSPGPDIDLATKGVQKIESGDGLRENIFDYSKQGESKEDIKNDQGKLWVETEVSQQTKFKSVGSDPITTMQVTDGPILKKGIENSMSDSAGKKLEAGEEAEIVHLLRSIGDNIETGHFEDEIQKLQTHSNTKRMTTDSRQEKINSDLPGEGEGKPDQGSDFVTIKISKGSTSDAEDLLLDPANTFPPAPTKRKRSYQRSQSYDTSEPSTMQSLIPDQPTASGSKSPSVEKPVTVFTSLEHGLATLSAEDEAKYLAMVQEIQRRDEILFEAANAKRRTSLQMASRPAVLLEVCQRHLLSEAKAMKPSVSTSERAKYMKIYEQFVSNSTGNFDKSQSSASQVGKRATLA